MLNDKLGLHKVQSMNGLGCAYAAYKMLKEQKSNRWAAIMVDQIKCGYKTFGSLDDMYKLYCNSFPFGLLSIVAKSYLTAK